MGGLGIKVGKRKLFVVLSLYDAIIVGLMLYLSTTTTPFYGHYTGQPVLASTSS